jgi:hypothetical protein
MTHVWTWGGVYFGYFDGDDLWTHDGKHAARRHGNDLFNSRGRYVGEVIQDRLISNRSKSGWTGFSFGPSRRGAIGRFANYAGYAMYAGHEDFPPPESF